MPDLSPTRPDSDNRAEIATELLDDYIEKYYQLKQALGRGPHAVSQAMENYLKLRTQILELMGVDD